MAVLADMHGTTAIAAVTEVVAEVTDGKFAQVYSAAQKLKAASGPVATGDGQGQGGSGAAPFGQGTVTPGDMAIMAGMAAELAAFSTSGNTAQSKTAEATSTAAKG